MFKHIMNFITANCKNIIIRSVSCGFVSGFCVGCFPNKLCINFQNKKFNLVPIPFATGIICSVGLLISPLLIVNYFCNGVYFDKLIDKYDIDLERHYQCDGKNNKYAFPSFLILNIKYKK